MRLIISNLHKSYKDKTVLNGVDFEFEQGKIYCILGRNGAGKTTLFNCLNSDISFEKNYFIVFGWLEQEIEFDDICFSFLPIFNRI